MKRIIPTLFALVVMNCEDRFLVDDPYSELHSVDPSDILVFNIECEDPFQAKAETYTIKTYGPEPEYMNEPHVKDVEELFSLLPLEL